MDWADVIQCDDLDLAVRLFNEKVLTAANKHAPVKKLRVKGRQASWVTEGFIAEMRVRLLKEKSFQIKVHR